MAEKLIAGIETGGTKIIAQARSLDGRIVSEGRWQTSTADQALSDLTDFLRNLAGEGKLTSIGIAAFGPLVVDRSSFDYGLMLATPKAGWAGSNLRAAMQQHFDLPVVIDTDVNLAAVAEQQIGAGAGQQSVAYVTVGTGIGAGLAIEGRSLAGALHPEVGHLPVIRVPGDHLTSSCPFHGACVEGLAAGPAIQRRLGDTADLAKDPAVQDLVADYLGQLGASLVLAWSPHCIIWGGGVVGAGGLVSKIEQKLVHALGGYGVGDAPITAGFCRAALLSHSGLEGAILEARKAAAS